MRTLMNIIWLLFGGVELFFAYVVAGILACLLIVTIPAGVASFRIAGYVLWPFGRTVVRQPGAGAGSALMNFVWFIVAGWWLALGHIVAAAFQAVTIVGIPLAVGSIKLIPMCCFPYGKMIVDKPRGGGFPNRC